MRYFFKHERHVIRVKSPATRFYREVEDMLSHMMSPPLQMARYGSAVTIPHREHATAVRVIHRFLTVIHAAPLSRWV